MRHYTQLTREQRYQIYVLKKTGHKQKEIADAIGTHKSTVGRELRRNCGERGYRPKQADEKAKSRRFGKAPSRLKSTDWRRIERLIRVDWSPEQISGRIFQEKAIRVSHEWIYQHIYQDKFLGGDLHTHLRCRKKRKKRYGSYERRGQLINRVSIDQRPSIVDSKSRIGDWEGDTIIGKNHQGALVSMVERKSLFTVIEPVKNRTSCHVRQKLVKKMKAYKNQVHTITFDNGKEFAEHEKMSSELNAQIYFAHPYASWERGINENTNGLIRQYFPKTRDLSNLNLIEINNAMERLNNRPRKKLGFKTPFEVFFKRKNNIIDNVALTN